MKNKRVPKVVVSLGISAVLAAALIGYNEYRVNKEIDHQKVYFTKAEIPPRTKVTKDMLQERTVPSAAIPPNAIRNLSDIEGKYTVNGYGLSENSMIYKGKVVAKDDLPDAPILNLKENEVAFPLLVDIETSAGNSIVPGSHVDLYLKGTVKEENTDGTITEKPVFGRVAKHVRVTSVKDSEASNVFDPEGVKVDGSYQSNVEEEAKKRKMAKIYTFAVNEEENNLLNKGSLLGEIIPVASGQAYKTNVEKTNDDQIIKWIQSQSFKVK